MRRAGAFDEQSHRREFGHLLGTGQGVQRRQRERWHSPAHLADQPECLTAGGQDAEAWARPQQRVRHVRACLEQVLAVVEDQEDVSRLEYPTERREHGLRGHFADAEGGCDRLGYQRRIRH